MQENTYRPILVPTLAFKVIECSFQIQLLAFLKEVKFLSVFNPVFVSSIPLKLRLSTRLFTQFKYIQRSTL